MFDLDTKTKTWQESVYRSPQTYQDISRREWRSLRTRVYKRDRKICQRCLARFKYIRDISCHHIISRMDGGPDVLENLITLCHPCHDYIELHPEFNTRSLIENSYGIDRPLPRGVEYKTESQVDDERPDWHAWVYGGAKRPPYNEK